MNKRILTGLILGAVILLCIYAGNKYTSYLLMTINILGAYELSRMLKPKIRTPHVYLHVLLAICPFLLLDLFGNTYPLWDVFLITCIIVSFLLISLLYSSFKNYSTYSYLLSLLYWGLSFSLGSYYILNADSEMNLIALSVIVLIWTSDTMAYFTGRKYGKRKLFESVSPKKTIEGSLGAGVSCVIIGVILATILGHSILSWVAISLIIWIMGTYGDLVESKMKRSVNAKDSGTWLPGHGGFLDRFDSLVLIIPFLLLLTRL